MVFVTLRIVQVFIRERTKSDQWFGHLFIFRILVQICKTQAFQKLNPAQFDLHDAVNEAIQVSNGSDE